MRQPVFDAERETVAFRLSHRGAGEGKPEDPDLTGSRIIADLAAFAGLEPVTEGRRAFVPVTRDILINEFPRLLPPRLVIVDIPREQEADEVVVTRCRKLAAAGYTIAVDHESTPSPLLDAARIVKVKKGSKSVETIAEEVHVASADNRKTMVIDVSTWDDYNELVQAGVDYATGEFFVRPEAIRRREIPGNKLSCMRVVVEVHRPEIDVDELEEIIKLDVSMTYKLLQYINSSHVGTRQEISSMRHALVMLGKRELRRWVALVALTTVADDKPADLVVEGMTRARFAELLAPHVGLGERQDEMFLIGLLSVLEAVFDTPIAKIASKLPLSADVQRALVNPATSPLGTLLYAVLAYARGNWRAFDIYRQRTGMETSIAPTCHHEAMAWARKNAYAADDRAA